MKKNVGVVGIDLNKIRGEFGTKALTLSGNNFGNMLFTNAVYRQIPNCKHIGFKFDPKRVKAEFDHIVIPAANWINAKEDWGFLGDLIEECDLPVCLVGLGSQLSSVADADNVPEGTKRFLKAVEQRTAFIGVRGLFTKEVMNALGFHNVRALGCPSIFSSNQVPMVRRFVPSSRLRVGVGPTRYGLPATSQISDSDKQMQLYRYGLKHGSSIYYQSEAFEISLLNRENVEAQVDQALAYYGDSNFDELEYQLMRKGKYHKDIDQWRCDAMKDDVYIGTRIHGAVASMLSGTPAVLLTHDNRTRELADIMGIPCCDLQDFEGFSQVDENSFFSSFDYTISNEILQESIRAFADFYKNNSLSHHLVI